ncbi:L-aspartate oxidase [Nostocoides japonicum T1-X7]|uniref:L-aspartate oxidase n=1 Tax=Nostocoides japonicum T1-X7 TaxID=1194083 RepID=A0A077LT41_9MICO|nr:FAD-binding protein [Tetrasphaera japonica]CCH76553.1 L-aspartate oxidase [Tetrasphaera japonica T1-X7]
MSARPRPVVVGSGLAGLTTAAGLADHGCLLVTAGSLTEGAASMWAQGGIAAAVGPGDSPALHAQDTLVAGAYAGDPATIARITSAAPGVIEALVAAGVPFDRDGAGELALGLEGGHSRHRIVHAGDHSGATVTSTLGRLVAALPGVEVLERHTTVCLVAGASGEVAGLVVRDASGAERVLETDAIVLATGGLGGLFPHTTNPRTALGQGVALAARAGARTDDLHLVQFHPTGLDVGRDPMPLLTEALRGAGAVLLADGRRFVDELQPRDVVAAAVWAQLQQGRSVVLDARSVPDVATRFPSVAELCRESGLDVAADLLPVRPTVHYAMGGVTVDARSRTSVPGLWAVGEVSRTGLHGANRLASNSLLEAVVTGRAAAQDVLGDPARVVGWSAVPAPEVASVVPSERYASRRGSPSLADVRSLLGEACGVLRDGPTLRSAVEQLDPHTGDDVAYAAWLVARSALAHPHSIGAHRRTDDPAVREEIPA